MSAVNQSSKQTLNEETLSEEKNYIENFYLLKKTVRERKDSSPSPELILAKITPIKYNKIQQLDLNEGSEGFYS